jgi:hypothetical protein
MFRGANFLYHQKRRWERQKEISLREPSSQGRGVVTILDISRGTNLSSQEDIESNRSRKTSGEATCLLNKGRRDGQTLREPSYLLKLGGAAIKKQETLTGANKSSRGGGWLDDHMRYCIFTRANVSSQRGKKVWAAIQDRIFVGELNC